MYRVPDNSARLDRLDRLARKIVEHVRRLHARWAREGRYSDNVPGYWTPDMLVMPKPSYRRETAERYTEWQATLERIQAEIQLRRSGART